MNIFLDGGDWAAGAVPPPRPGRARGALRHLQPFPRQQPPPLRGDRRDLRGRARVGNPFTAPASPPTAGVGSPPQAFPAGGHAHPRPSPPLSEGSRRTGSSAANFTKAQLLPRRRPPAFSPVPPGSGRCRGRWALQGDMGERKRRGSGPGAKPREADSEPRPPRETVSRGALGGAGTHRGRHGREGRREGRRALSPALKSRRRPSLFFPDFYWWLFHLHLLLPPPRENIPPPVSSSSSPAEKQR